VRAEDSSMLGILFFLDRIDPGETKTKAGFHWASRIFMIILLLFPLSRRKGKRQSALRRRGAMGWESNLRLAFALPFFEPRLNSPSGLNWVNHEA
jgi:hypothetical protein